jgi:hypothetical protein
MRSVGDIALDAEVRAIASGAITDGGPVIVNSAGTVSGVTAATALTVGTAVEFDTNSAGSKDVCFDSNSNRVFISYRDAGNSNYGTGVVGSINPADNSVSFGTPVVFESGSTAEIDNCFDSNSNRVVTVYQDQGNSSYGTAVVGSIDSSDNSVSFGTPVVFNSGGNSYYNSIAFDSNVNKTLNSYNNSGDSESHYAIVGTVDPSDNSISFGTAVKYETGGSSSGYGQVVFDSSTNKFVLAYQDGGDSNKGKAIVGTISGTDVSFGTAAEYESGATVYVAGTFDSTNNKTVIVYVDQNNSNYGTAVVATVSGTSVSFGTPVVFESATTITPEAEFDASVDKVVVNYRDGGNSNYHTVVLGTVSGTSISFGTPFLLISGLVHSVEDHMTYDSHNERMFFAFGDAGDSNKGKGVVLRNAVPTNITSENFIGFAHAAYADGQKATVKTTGSIARNIPQIASASSTLGTAVSFESATTSRIASCFDSTNNRIVVSYVDSGSDDDGTVAVGTVNASDNSISWGTPVAFNSNVKITDSQIIHDSNSNKIVVAYTDEDNSFYGTGIVGTIDTSDNSISFGSPTVYESANTNTSSRNGITFDSNSNKVVIVYTDQGNSNYGTAVVGTVSGTSISFGTPVVFESAQAIHMGATFDTSNNKVVIAYRDVGNSDYGTAIVGTVSGTSISFGTAVVYESAESDWNSITFDSNSNKVVISYQDKGNSNYGTAIVGTVSGTSISFGTAVVYESASVNYTAIDFDSNLNKVIIGYEDIGNSEYGTFVIGTVSGTSISFTSPAVFYSGELSWVGVSFDSNAKRSVFTYRDADNSNNGRSVVLQPAGIGEDLTIGQQYFVQTDGTLGTSADDPSVIAGTAIGASDIIVKG